jgi:hypothetical protein
MLWWQKHHSNEFLKLWWIKGYTQLSFAKDTFINSVKVSMAEVNNKLKELTSVTYNECRCNFACSLSYSSHETAELPKNYPLLSCHSTWVKRFQVT